MAVLRNVHTTAKFGICLLLCQFIIFCLITNIVTAQRQTSFGGESWVKNNEHEDYPIDMSTGRGTLNYSVRVTSGHRIDIILFNKDNYEAYINGEPANYIEIGTALDIYDVFLTTDLDRGDYYLVIDNTDFGIAEPPTNHEMGGVQIEYNVEYTSTHDSFSNVN